MGPPWDHKPCQQTCSGMGSSLHGSAGPGRSLLQCGLPMGSQLPSGIHLLWLGVPSMGCRWISAPAWTSTGCRGTACLTRVFSTVCRGTSALVPGAPPAPAFSLTLVSAELFLSHILTPFSSCKMPLCRCFYTFLNGLPQRHYHCHRWARPWPTVGPSWSQLALALLDVGEASSSFSQKPSLQPPHLLKPCHANPVQGPE